MQTNLQHPWRPRVRITYFQYSVMVAAVAAGCSDSAVTPRAGSTVKSPGSGGGSQDVGQKSTGGADASSPASSVVGGGTSTPPLSDATGGVLGIGGANGGAADVGGTNNAAGSNAIGGTRTGGSSAIGGTTSGSSNATGGIAGTGGSKATGGRSAAGGTLTGGMNAAGSPSDDRCALGVYDVASPPKALTLSGVLGSHDPSMIESDGTYYLFATGLGAKTSKNLTTWTDAPRPFTAPTWAQTAVPGVTDLWAADITYFGGKYHLYYSASTFGSNRSCIGHATKASLSGGSWTDEGVATICSNVNSTDDWNAIDPAVVLDETGKPWMAFGSFWSGIKLIELDRNGERIGTTVTSVAARPKNSGAIEGPYIVRRCGYYYLFTSWDTCCKGANSTYNIRVGRSPNVKGPYADRAGTALLQGGGTLVAESGGSWVGPGGQSVMIAGNKAYLVYHAYASSNGNATLRIADLVWDETGWPVAVEP